MKIFKKYAELYDLLNKDKDYEGEARQISKTLQKYGIINGASVLNLGCGTGKHDHILAKMGYEMTGVDMSQEMVDIALNPLVKGGVGDSHFLQGDIRSIDLNKKFDAVISMFHVMSYQNTNEDVEAGFKTAFNHLVEGGVFLFDCWYGPAVLSEKPENRERIVENDELKVVRIATPELKEKENIVVVNYDFKVIEKDKGETIEFSEKHNMRYFFIPEIKFFMKNCGFDVISVESNGWNLEVVGKKV